MAVKFESVKLDIEGYKKICLGVFKGLGVSEKCASEVTDNLLFADMRGTNSHGLTRLKQYTDRILQGAILPDAEPEIVSERGSALVIDGHRALGAHTATFAMKKTIEKAKVSGMAFTTVRNSSHFGVAAYYSTMALPENMIGFAFTNSLPFVAHYGAKQACTGTNPLTIALPCEKNLPFVLDMATSVVARGNILNCAKEGKDIPFGWAMDRNGYPTTDAKAAMEGFCLPLGADRSYKGSGLCLAVDSLCGVLSGGPFGPNVKNNAISHAFGAVNIDFFMDPAEFKARMDEYVEALKSAPLAPDFEEILMPGEPEYREYARHKASGTVDIALENFHEVCLITEKFCPEIDPKSFLKG
ncbi:MAG: Ldh family oxidoreductase [Lachnospiraceae bacterium]|nr:Ldh family oxidoreductase [Lachnospiraceae bacterium]